MERYNDYYGMIPKGLAGFKVMAELWKLGEKIVGKISKTFGKNTNAASKTKVGYGLRHLPKRALATAGTITATAALDAAALDNASDSELNPSLFWPLASTAMLVGSVLYPNLYMRYGKSGALKGLVGMPKTAKEWVEKNGGVGYLPSGQLNPFKLGFRLENPTNIMSDLNLQAKAYGRIGFYEKELANFNKAAFASDKSQKNILDKVNKKIKDHNDKYNVLKHEGNIYTNKRDEAVKELQGYSDMRYKLIQKLDDYFYRRNALLSEYDRYLDEKDVLRKKLDSGELQLEDLSDEQFSVLDSEYPRHWTTDDISVYNNLNPEDMTRDMWDIYDNSLPKGWTDDKLKLVDNELPENWSPKLRAIYRKGEIEPYSSIDEYADALNDATGHVISTSEENRLSVVFGENPVTLSVSKYPTSADTHGALWRNFLRILDWVGPIVFGTTTVASWLNYGHSGSGSKENNKQSEDSDSTSIAAEAKKTPVLNPNSTVGQSTTPISNDGIIFNGYQIINQ